MILLSGGFDPLHPGHIEMIRQAAEYGDVTIALNSDDWLIKKKGFCFQSWIDRAHILRALKWTFSVEPVDDSDGTVCEAIERLSPECFGNGGDRTESNTPEVELCMKLGVKPVFGLGGGKFRSSSAICAKGMVQRQWGEYVILDEGINYKVKRLTLEPGEKTSRQKHEKRTEYWIYPKDNKIETVWPGEWHQLINPWKEPLEVIEIQIGICEEDDIERM